MLGRAPALETDDPDVLLMKRIAAQDESALAAIYDRHAAGVFSLLRRMLRDEAAAEDIQQDVFFHLWEIAARFDPERGTVKAWLLVMARNRAISFLRQRPETDSDHVEVRVASSALPQDITAAHSELVRRIRSILDRLAPEQSAVFELAYFDGMTHAEIADRTGQPLGTVKSRLRSALSILRQELQR